MDAQPPARPSEETLWRWLAEVPDPEIPVISVVDLGIVRAVRWDGDTLVVTVTPTYSGCPATRVINEDIVAHLRTRGIERARTERQLSPAWTSAWLSASGREKLRAYGIAPPLDGGPGCAVAGALGASVALPHPSRPGAAGAGVGAGGAPFSRAAAPAVACPRCGARDAERVSQFGSTPCKASYRCRECLEPFDYFKCI